jgi:hypothetical protein
MLLCKNWLLLLGLWHMVDKKMMTSHRVPISRSRNPSPSFENDVLGILDLKTHRTWQQLS